ncbi:hypothetical protein BABINDRAFT_30156 [Babjeviella inositovora NRRL Y-12698]|uniref:Ribosomal protein/NADH dehydrogenase domain-containing protein n=1 Tax=Babjeviella inositovora NRRL Y-12698 TaxID=984486 RepID=A0A1E3QXS3_9ASCO|nr:uncharacterized protein BABINDRAFT_30156 [Babjeviella inositovora NRRL Y-12698]ODQ82344.1 hypothetical protein BABINDRAFT_30156 [Babjeviella inositovora NRRL Y-12698]
MSAAKFVLPVAVKELRFHLSQTGQASVPLRTFLTQHYPTLKKSNPNVPILIREAYSVPPSITARFEKGVESKQSVDGLTAAQVDATFKSLLGL